METITKFESRYINVALMREQLISTFGVNLIGFEYAGYEQGVGIYTTEMQSTVEGRIYVPRTENNVTRKHRENGAMVATPGYTNLPGELRFRFETPLTTEEKNTLTTNIANHNEFNTTQTQKFEDQDEIDYPEINRLRKITNRNGNQNTQLLNRIARTVLRQGKNLREF